MFGGLGVERSPGPMIRRVMRRTLVPLSVLLISSACGESSIGSTAPVNTSTSIPATTDPSIPSTTTPLPAAGLVLADFTAEDSVVDWYVQNDTVMGGVSSSSVSWDDGELIFSGNLSTENNGGFTSMRGPVVSSDPVTGLGTISVVARGDGRTYLMQIRTDTDSYIQRFTPDRTMSETTLRLSDFVATDWRLDPIPDRPPLVSEAVRQVALYLVDKQVGEFVLRLRSISMVVS